jgi:hypothetical protein
VVISLIFDLFFLCVTGTISNFFEFSLPLGVLFKTLPSSSLFVDPGCFFIKFDIAN